LKVTAGRSARKQRKVARVCCYKVRNKGGRRCITAMANGFPLRHRKCALKNRPVCDALQAAISSG
jgi:hypothetical protein